MTTPRPNPNEPVGAGPRHASKWRRYLRFWGPDAERDLDDELQFHLSARRDEYLAAGMTPEEALAAAAQRFGDFEAARDACAKIDSQWQREISMIELLDVLAADVRFALRQLRRNPSLSLAAILCFALGIGANTAIFSVVDAVLFRPLPFRSADRLVLVGEGLPQINATNFGTISAAEYADYRALDGRIFSGTAIFESDAVTLAGTGDVERIPSAKVSATLFDVLGVRAARGRTFATGEDHLNAPAVAVLSDAFWRRRFGADSQLVGKSLSIDGRAVTVVGVLPRGVSFPLPGLGNGIADIFLPYLITPQVERQRGNSYATYLVGRLAPGVSLAEARGAVDALARRLPEVYPSTYGVDRQVVADAFSLRGRAVGDVRTALLVLLAAAGFVLLLACLNVATLLLARAASRQRELAVRVALGATRRRLAQQFLAEGIVLVVVGGTAGVLLAGWTAPLLAARAPESLLAGYDVSLNLPVLGFALLVAAAAAAAFSLVPVLHQSERSLTARLRDDGRGASSGGSRQRARRALVVAEIALALVLAAGAGLLLKSFARMRGVDPGFNPERLLTFSLAIPSSRYPDVQQVTQIRQRVIDRLQRIPGVTSVSAGSTMPMARASQIAFALEGKHFEQTPFAMSDIVMPGYIETMEIPRRAGESISDRDRPGTPPVALVNETLARQYFGTAAAAVGQRLKWGSERSSSPWATIIGVVADVKQQALDQVAQPAVYFAALQQDTLVTNGMLRDMTYVARTSREPATIVRSLRAAVREVAPDIPMENLRTADEVMSASSASRRFNTVLLAAFAALAVLLASAGVFGLMNYSVTQRTREIGIRLALGARPLDVLQLVLGEGTRLAAIGIVIGLAGALALTRALRTLLFDVSPLDFLTLVSVAALLLGVAALASFLPGRRASRVDPQVAVRES